VITDLERSRPLDHVTAGLERTVPLLRARTTYARQGAEHPERVGAFVTQPRSLALACSSPLPPAIPQ